MAKRLITSRPSGSIHYGFEYTVTTEDILSGFAQISINNHRELIVKHQVRDENDIIKIRSYKFNNEVIGNNNVITISNKDQTSTITFDKDFVEGNIIDISVNGVDMESVEFDTDNATTYDLIKTALENILSDSTITVDDSAKTVEIMDTMTKTVVVNVTGTTPSTASVVETTEKYQVTVTYSGDFAISNLINFNVNGNVTVVGFDTDNATTYDNLKTALESMLPDATVVVDAVAHTVVITDMIFTTVTSTVTGGVAPTAGVVFLTNQVSTVTYSGDFVEYDTVNFDINSLSITPVSFDTDNATTYTNLKTAIETIVPTATVIIDDVAKTVVIKDSSVTGVASTIDNVPVDSVVTDDNNSDWLVEGDKITFICFKKFYIPEE